MATGVDQGEHSAHDAPGQQTPGSALQPISQVSTGRRTLPCAYIHSPPALPPTGVCPPLGPAVPKGVCPLLGPDLP